MKHLHSAAAMAALTALAIPNARASDLIQFDDAGETVRILLNGVPHNFSDSLIANFLITPVPQAGGDTGEVVTFDYLPVNPGVLQLFDGTTSNLPYIYAQLWEPNPAGGVIVSDEFGIRPIVDAAGFRIGFQVAFTSADQNLIQQQFPGQTLTVSPLSAFEVPGYQDVGYLAGTSAHDTVFQISSVPETDISAMLLAGLGGLALLRRRQRNS